MAMLEIRDLNVYYGGIHALKGISLEVEEGQIVSMIGSNGAGKSSMMNAISGIVKYKSGDILYKGQPLPTAANKVVRLGVCQVPEGRLIFANLTVYENLKVGAYLRSDKDGIERDLKRVYEIFPRLAERKPQLPAPHTGGAQQQAAPAAPAAPAAAAAACTACGQPIAAGSKFCPSCGAKQEENPAGGFCPNCGGKVEAGSKFCTSCGN